MNYRVPRYPLMIVPNATPSEPQPLPEPIELEVPEDEPVGDIAPQPYLRIVQFDGDVPPEDQ